MRQSHNTGLFDKLGHIRVYYNARQGTRNKAQVTMTAPTVSITGKGTFIMTIINMSLGLEVVPSMW